MVQKFIINHTRTRHCDASHTVNLRRPRACHALLFIHLGTYPGGRLTFSLNSGASHRRLYSKQHRMSVVSCKQRLCDKKLSCRREAARCFVSLNISLSHSRSLKMVHLESFGTVSYSHSIETTVVSVSLAVSTQYTNVTASHPASQTPHNGIAAVIKASRGNNDAKNGRCTVAIWLSRNALSVIIQRSCATPGPVSTSMGDRLTSDKPSRCRTSHLVLLSLAIAPSRCNEYLQR